MLQTHFSTAETHSLNIVTIDDDPSIRELIENPLFDSLEEGARFRSYSNALEAIQDLWEGTSPKSAPIDILFLDIFLEGEGTGIDVLEYCQYQAQPMNIILMSSDFTERQLNRVAKMNLNPILLRKPFGPQEVVSLANWGRSLKK